MTDATFGREEGRKMRKPSFLFGDKMKLPEDCLFNGNYKWLRLIGGEHILFPNMERSHPLSYLQASSIPTKMDWQLTKPQDGVLLRSFGVTSAFSTNTGKHIIGLLLGSLKKEQPVRETYITASTFLNCFVIVHGEFPYQDFRLLGWAHSSEKAWWSALIAFVFKKFESQLKRIVYQAIQAVQHGILSSCFNFFSTLELYNLEIGTFFTLFVK